MECDKHGWKQRAGSIIKEVCPFCVQETAEALIKPQRPVMRFNESGSKYLREVPCVIDGKIDVYAVLDAFNVICPARQHALKKLLCTGIRGKGDALQDLKEARDAITRAIQMEESRNKGEK